MNIKRELFISQFGQLEGLKVATDWDPQVAKAITFLPEAQTSRTTPNWPRRPTPQAANYPANSPAR